MSEDPSNGPEIVIHVASSAEADIDEIEGWLRRVAREVAPEADSLGVSLVGDGQMRAMNKRYRAVDSSTDVLSFPGEKTSEEWHLGDILISIPAARRQALEIGHPLRREFQCLLLHGLLHCLGHDHETDNGAMDRLEFELRERWIEPGAKARP